MKRTASLIAKYEGKKSQARIGDIREILKVYAAILAGSDQVTCAAIRSEGGASMEKMQTRADRLRAKGLNEEQRIKKLLGRK